MNNSSGVTQIDDKVRAFNVFFRSENIGLLVFMRSKSSLLHNNLKRKTMSNDKSATEKISTYAENTAESAGNTLKNAKENVFGKA